MRRLYLNIFLCLGLLAILQSCQKTSQGPFVPNPTPTSDTTWNSNDSIPPVTANIDKPVYVDSFNCNDDDGAKISIGDSVLLVFPAGGCMIEANKPSTTIKTISKVTAKILILTTKGEFIRHKISSQSNGNLLEFGAHISIKLFYHNNPVYWNSNLPKQIQVRVKIKDNKPLQTMQFYRLQYDSIARDTFWLPVLNNHSVNVSPVFIGLGNPNRQPNGYLFNTNTVGSFGCNSSLQVNTSTTRLNVLLPLNCTNKNTVVYAVFNDYKTVVRLKSYPLGKSFSVGGIPTGTKITLVSITKIDDNFYLGTESVVTKDSTPFKITPTLSDLSTVSQFLRTL